MKRFRLERQPQWRQEDLAARLGVTQQRVSEWESGTCMPTLVTAFAIAAALGVSVEAVFFVQYAVAAERLQPPLTEDAAGQDAATAKPHRIHP